MTKDSDNNSTEIFVYNTIEEFEKNLPNTVELIHTPNGDKVYVIGTAHFSRKSQDDVSFVMRNTKPGAVVLELCPLRLHILQFDEETLMREAMDLSPDKIKQIIRDQGLMNGMFYVNFLKTNASITEQLGIAPGGECRRAVAEAKKMKNCKVLLGDRRLDITLKRALGGLTLSQKLMLAWSMAGQKQMKITVEEIEKYKQRDFVPLENMKVHMPSAYRSFVSERDIVLAHSLMIAVKYVKDKQKLKNTNNDHARIVGVVGMGHMRGILENFGKTTTDQVASLMTVPNEPSPPKDSSGQGGYPNLFVNWIGPHLPKIKTFFKRGR